MTYEALMDTCERIGLPYAPITKPHELYDDPHLNQSGNLLDITLPDSKVKTRVPGLPLELGGRRIEIRHDLPEIGEHGREILIEAGFSNIDINNMEISGALLKKLHK